MNTPDFAIGISLGKPHAVAPAGGVQQHDLARARRPRGHIVEAWAAELEPAEPQEHVVPPGTVIDPVADRLAELAVARHVDAELLLMAHGIADRAPQRRLERRLVRRLAGVARAVRRDQIVGARQAADMARQDMVGAGSHGPLPHSWRLASAAPCASASSLAQAICG